MKGLFYMHIITFALIATLAAATLCAAPSSNTVEAITQDCRQGNYSYANEFFPSLSDTELELHHTWAQTTWHEMSSDFVLNVLWNNNL